MWIDAELVLTSYKPLKLEKGMLFVNAFDIENGFEVYELERDILDVVPYMTKYGCPVELSLFVLDASHPQSYQLATHNEIAWVDEGDASEDMHEITMEDLNSILRNKGVCQIQIIDNLYREMCIPVFDEEKVIIKLIEKE